MSPEILRKTNMGLWAFELDEGRAPRMYVDDAMLPLLGLKEQVSPEETYHAWYDHVDSASVDLVAESVEKMASGHHAEVQYPWHHPDGHTMTVRCGGIRNPAYTRGVRIEGYHQDVSETFLYTSELAKQRRRLERDYQTIQGLSNEYDVLHLLNLDTDEFTPFYIENVSQVDTDFLLASYEGFYSALRASVENTVHPDYKEKMLRYTEKEYIKEVLRHKARQVERILVKNPEGEYSWNDFVLIKFDDTEAEAVNIAIGYVNVDDEMKSLIAERERLEGIERKVEEERRAKEAESERYNFLINVTHEIRTPLTLIMGPMERLQNTEQLTDKGRRAVSRVRQQAAKMNTLLTTVLTANRMEEGAEEVRPVPVAFNDWVTRISDDFVDEAEHREMPLRYDLSPAVGNVNLDEHLCNIVLSNFIINAMRYNEPGSHILIGTSLVNDGKTVRVSIKDRGAGIGDVDAPHLFERYYRATEDKTGFGIGLFYSKKIIEAHNGNIGAYNNTDGSGATFWFELPVD